MKKSLCILSTLLMSASVFVVTGCEKKGDVETTAEAVAKAGEMTLEELEAASKAEMEASNDTFKVYGLTSTLSKALSKFANKYDWITYGSADSKNDNAYCNNSFKDAALFEALTATENSYVCDFALIQDARSLAGFMEGGLTHNFVPSDYATLGLQEKDTLPLKGIYFNKIFYTNTNFEYNAKKAFTNVWQVAGTSADVNHIGNFSFQNPTTEQINMSFLLSLQDPANAGKLETSYKAYYGKDWTASTTYPTIGDQYVTELVKNVSTWHTSDGTAMKETQAKDTAGYVYYGAYAKMKDSVEKFYPYDLNQDGDTEDEGEDSVCAMDTVKWNTELSGFNGFMYCMYSQIANNAKHPYTACLYARYFLEPECYQAMCYNSKTPNKAGETANMYGYYYPCVSTTVGINDNDWTKEKWIEMSIVEDYNYLKTVKTSQVDKINTLVNK